MKQCFVIALFLIGFAGCTSPSNAPGGNGGTSSNLTYQVVHENPSITPLVEHTTLSDAGNNIIAVSRLSDTIGGFFTTVLSERYQTLTNGDWWRVGSQPIGCDSAPLPVETHHSYSPTPLITPTKKNGIVGEGGYCRLTRYDGEESIFAAGQSFRCSKVEETVKVWASNGSGGIDTTLATHIYWYSPALKFFVKDQAIGSYTRTLISY